MTFNGANQYKAMPPPSQTTLEVTVISAEEVRLPSGRTLGHGGYATVRTAESVASTDVDGDSCNGCPWWNETLRLMLPANAGAFHLEILRRRAGGVTEPIAGATVPVEDFTVGPPGHLHCLSYRLFGPGNGRRNGIVNISVKRLNGEGKAPMPAAGKAVDAGASGSGYCCGGHSASEEWRVAAPPGVVMGYPVGFSGHGKPKKGYV